MVVQESTTDSRVIVLDSNSMKLKATLFFPNQLVKKVSFHPSESSMMVTTGTNHFRVWKLLDGQFKPFQQVKLNQNLVYTEHMWLEKDQLLVFSQDGVM
jgi:hypothetical protein